jgi:hypothetical protein
MPNPKNKAKNGKPQKNGEIIPISRAAGKEGRNGQDGSAFFRPADPSNDLAAVERKSGPELVEWAAYNRFGSVRRRALEMLSNDSGALKTVARNSPYPDTVSEAESLAAALDSADGKTS